MNIDELLDQITKRPTMYIGEPSIFCLKAFIDGFVISQEYACVYNNQSISFMAEFQAWIEKKYNVSTTQSWARIISFFTPDQPAALDEALKLLNEFKSTIWDKKK